MWNKIGVNSPLARFTNSCCTNLCQNPLDENFCCGLCSTKIQSSVKPNCNFFVKDVEGNVCMEMDDSEIDSNGVVNEKIAEEVEALEIL